MALIEPADIDIRLATAADTENLFEWRNHPSIRAVSRTSEPIPREAHDRWIRATLSDPGRCLLIGSQGGAPAGVVRFDLETDRAEVSIYLVPERRGQGLGAPLLVAAEGWLRTGRPEIAVLEAEVLGDNRPSHRLFASCGYSRTGGHYRKRLPP